MTRQENITLTQVENMRDKAARDAMHFARLALAAANNQFLYEENMEKSRKAAQDFGTWSKCLENFATA